VRGGRVRGVREERQRVERREEKEERAVNGELLTDLAEDCRVDLT